MLSTSYDTSLPAFLGNTALEIGDCERVVQDAGFPYIHFMCVHTHVHFHVPVHMRVHVYICVHMRLLVTA